MVMFTTELVVQKKGSSMSDKWTMKDYLQGNLELVHVTRRAGLNDVGMVAWSATLKTVEYPNVRLVCLLLSVVSLPFLTFFLSLQCQRAGKLF